MTATYIDAEPAPEGLHLDYGYSMYSARYGNVYTARQLLQLLRRALGRFDPQAQIWHPQRAV